MKIARIPNSRADLKKAQLNKLVNGQSTPAVVRDMASAILASMA
jgi:hypothetical protein